MVHVSMATFFSLDVLPMVRCQVSDIATITETLTLQTTTIACSTPSHFTLPVDAHRPPYAAATARTSKACFLLELTPDHLPNTPHQHYSLQDGGRTSDSRTFAHTLPCATACQTRAARAPPACPLAYASPTASSLPAASPGRDSCR